MKTIIILRLAFISLILVIVSESLISQAVILGSTTTPVGSANDTLLFYDESKGALRGGRTLGLGWNPSNIGFFSLAYGESTVASGSSAIALGRFSQATGTESFAVGNNAKASGSISMALGQNTIASGQASTAFGFDSDATGPYAIAGGQLNLASGSASVALGSQNKATQTASSAFGIQTQANGLYSFSAGRGSIAGSRASFVLGRWNIGGGNATQWMAEDPLFEIGNGGADNNRNNAFTVLKDGKIGIGTHNPERLLDVRGGQQIKQNSSVNNPQLLLHEEATTDYSRLTFANNNPETSWTIAARPMSNITSSSMNFHLENVGNIMTIAGDKQVGIGTTAPSDRLQIDADANEDALRVRINSSTKLRVHDNGGTSIGVNNETGTPVNGMYVSGKVGLGVSNPTEKLEVNGAVVIKDSEGSKAGAVRYHNGDFEGFDGTKWVSLTKVNTGWGADLAIEPTLVEARTNIPSPNSDLYFGSDIASDGEWLAVSASDSPLKSTYFYKGGGQYWEESQVINFTTSASFSSKVAMADDRTTIRTGSDTMKVYALINDQWQFSQEIDLPGPNSIQQIYMSSDYLAISTWSYLYIYKSTNGGLYNFQASISLNGSSGTSSLSINENADVIAVGQPLSGATSGLVYLFERTNDSWLSLATLTAPSPSSGDYFGFSVAVSGNRIAVGTPFEDAQYTNQGAVYVFEKTNGNWILDGTILSQEPASDGDFGHALDFSGNYLVVNQHKFPFNSYLPIVQVYQSENGFWPFMSKLEPNIEIDGNYLYGGRLLINDETIFATTTRSGSYTPNEDHRIFIFCR